ncbi:hypothetical protein [Rurimicrobium arvi]|uniref:Uncharacterized protein n=1 Tax=Rurimicrobium arvi TaxID=2049916 RepID=A0ABP8MX68_9BACT
MQIEIKKPDGISVANLIVENNKIEYSDPTRKEEISGNASLFVLLTRLREVLEKDGIFLLIKGSRIDVHPSGLQTSMGGFGAYIHTIGKGGGELVDIFAPLEAENINFIGTTQQQSEYFREWAKSIGINIPE